MILVKLEVHLVGAMDWTKEHKTANNIQHTVEIDLVFLKKYFLH